MQSKKSMTKEIYRIVLGVLALVALVLGYLIIAPQKSGAPAAPPPSAEEPSRNATTTPSAAPSAPRDLSRLSEDERKVLMTPQQTSSEEEKRKHFELAGRISRETDKLDIAGCLGNPVVIRVKDNSTFTIANSDTIAHTIQINSEHQYLVPAKGTVAVKASFGFGAGAYGYGCDNSQGAAGIFFVIP